MIRAVCSDDFMKKARFLTTLRWRLDVKPIAPITEFYFSHFCQQVLSAGSPANKQDGSSRWFTCSCILESHRLWLEVKNSIRHTLVVTRGRENASTLSFNTSISFPFPFIVETWTNKLFSLPLEQFVPASVNENWQNLRKLETYLSRLRVIGPRWITTKSIFRNSQDFYPLRFRFLYF